jgi:formylglycine-generating enzyme required for sulfatase activity
VKATVTQGCAARACEASFAARAGAVLSCEAPCKVRFEDGSGGSPKQICWRPSAGEAELCGTALRTEHTYALPGRHVVTRRATYDCGETATVTLQLDVRPRLGPVVPGASCPAGMVAVPAGKFRMGSPDGVGDASERPLHEVTLPAYCIDRTEVTVKDYATCVAAGRCSPAALTVNRSGYTPDKVARYSGLCNRADRADHPINCVDWSQAAAYCTWAGKRLPTEAEWEYAARGTDGRTYAWGNAAPTAGRLNACGPECVAMLRRDLDLPFTTKLAAVDRWETTAPVGSFAEGASPFGALDMTGNVWEWTADWYGPYTAAPAAGPRGPRAGSYRVLRGGSWINVDGPSVRAARREGTGPAVRDNEIGFRCARGA